MKHRFCLVVLFSVFFYQFSTAQQVTLQEVVAMSLQKNYEVRIQQVLTASAYNDKKYSLGALLPLVNGVGSYVQNNNDSRNITFSDIETIRTGVTSINTNGSAQLVWTLFDGTKMFATRRRISQLADLGEINVKNQMMNSVASVINNYYSIVRQKQQLKAVNELMSVNEERVKLAERKLQVGIGGKPELLQAKVDLNAQRTAALQQETLINQLKDQLNGLLGMGLPDVYEIADTIPINLNLTFEDIVNDLENTNQALQIARKNVDIATTALRENRAARSPVINFTSSYNYNRIENSLQINPASQKYTRNKGFNYGLTMTVPILNGLNVTRLVNQAEITLSRQKLIYEQQKVIAIVGVRNAFVNYTNAKKALLIEEENILLARENVFIALEGFKRGITTFIELRTAQQSLADAYNRLIAARYLAKTSEIELLRLKGDLLTQN